MKILKFFLPFDVYIRHKFVSWFLQENLSVLDVGGSLSKIEDFIKLKKFRTADIKNADIIYDGKKLPLKAQSFDVVVSLDTLEHLQRSKRCEFVKELLRVAGKRVVIAAPLGTKKHINYEQKLIKSLRVAKRQVPRFLSEHVENGLPTLEEIKDLVPQQYSWKIYFSGNFKLMARLFRLHLFETKNRVLNRFLYYFKFLVNLFCNLFLYPLMANLPYTQTTNRFYLVINR